MNRKTNESIGQGRGYSGLARVLAVLALLVTAATGAWADETLLLTIESKDYKDFKSGSMTFDDKVTVTFSNKVQNDGDEYGWYTSGASLLTVAGTNGYTITSCKFYTEVGPANTGYTVEGESPSVFLADGEVYTGANNSVLLGYPGIAKIEVYTAAAPVAVTGVTLPSTSSVTLGDAVALTAAVAPADATDKKVKWTVTAGTDKVKLYKDADCKTEVGTDATDALTVYAKGLAAGEATVKVESNADATKSATCTVTAKHGTYAVAMKDGVTDGDKWTAKAGQDGQYQAMPLKGVEGGTKPVELKYGGDLEVKRVTMRVLPAWKGDLSKLSATELESDGVTVLVKNGMTLTGTLSENYKITIADGATVTLDGVTISGANDENYNWAGINCAGSATINLADDTENTVKGFYEDYPGIHVPSGATLTIQGGSAGTGKLTANSNGNAAGIGGGKALACGSIIIVGGTVTATGGGTGAGIGGGEAAACGSITIADGVTKVIATKGTGATNSIGEGFGGYCGAVNIGGTVYYDGSDYQNDGATYLAQATIEYPKPVALIVNPVVGQIIGSDGKNYAANATLPDGVTAVAKICYVSGDHGLALAMADENKMAWSTAISTCEGKTPTISGCTWKLATKDEWDNMISGYGLDNLKTTADGYTGLQSDRYWSRTEDGSSFAWGYQFDENKWISGGKSYAGVCVRACLAF